MCAMNPRLLRPLATGYQYKSLRQGLVAYWPLNESVADGDILAIDETGRGNHLASNNSVLSATGKVGNGRQFVAANSEYLSRASNTDLQFGDGDWTVACWVYVPDRSDGDQMIVGKDQSGGREAVFAATVTAATTANRFGITVFHTDGTFAAASTSVRLKASFVDRWWHVAATHQNGTLTIYANGVAEGTASRAAGKAFAATGTQFNVGRRSFSGFPNHLESTVDELAKWSRALSASEIAALYNNGNGISLAAPRPALSPFAAVSNADAQDWVNRVYANGGTVSASTATAVNTFCNAIDAAGIRDRFARLNLFAGNSLNAALVPLYRSTSYGGSALGNTTDTNNGPFVSGDYTLTGGLNANGTAGSSSKYLDTGLAPDDLPALDSVHLAAWKGAGSVNASTITLIGSRTATQFWYVRQNATTDNLAGNIGHGVFVTGASADTSAGLVTMTRDTSGLVIYKDTTSVATDGARTPTANANDFTVFNFRTTDGSVPSSVAWPYAIYGYSIGVNLSSADVASYRAAFAAFNTAMGRA